MNLATAFSKYLTCQQQRPVLSPWYGTLPQGDYRSTWRHLVYPGTFLPRKVLWFIQIGIDILGMNCLSCPSVLAIITIPRVCSTCIVSQYSRVGIRVSSWQRDIAIISHSWKCESEQWWLDSYGHGDLLSTYLYKKEFISLNVQVLPAPSEIASAAENPTSYGGPHPATYLRMSKKLQPTHLSELGSF